VAEALPYAWDRLRHGPWQDRLSPVVARMRTSAPIVAIVGLAAFLMSFNLSQPWVSNYEDNGLVFMSAALNDIRYGLGPAKGELLVDTATLNAQNPLGIPGVPASQEFHYLLTGPITPYVYANHPPLIGPTILLSLLVFGYHFWAVRLVPLLYSLGSVLLFYALVKRLFDRRVALGSTFLFVTYPMLAYFGRNVCFESPVLFWMLVLLYSYVRWHSEPRRRWRPGTRRRWLALMAVAVVFGTLYDWPMIFFAVILWVVDVIAERRLSGALALSTLLPACVTFVALIGQIYWAFGGTLHPLLDIFLLRSGSTGYGSGLDGMIAWLKRVIDQNTYGYGYWSLLAMPFAMVFAIQQARQEGLTLRIRLLAITCLCGLSNVLVFREGAFVHAYWQQYWLPFFALVIGWPAVTLAYHYFPNPRQRLGALALAGGTILLLNMIVIVGLYESKSHVFAPFFALAH
jgi:4-amino-4-deoxy-L-arabinose transferase-like glycosyltransferase